MRNPSLDPRIGGNSPARKIPFWQKPECWVVVIAMSVRMLILSRFAASPHFWPATDDMKFYADWATRILHGQWTDGQAFYGLPGYAFCLAGIFKVAGVSPLIVGLIQVGLETLTTVFIFKIATLATTESQNREPGHFPIVVGLLASLGWIFYLPAQTFSSILMPTAWVVAAYWGCVGWLMKGRGPFQLWTWLAFGIFLGVVAMMVATILFLIPLFLVAIVLRAEAGKRIPQISIAVALLMSGLFIGTSPAWLHNYFVANDPVLLSAHSGLNFWMGNNPDATGYPKIPSGLSAGQEGLLRDSITRAEEAAGKKLKRSEVSKYWSNQADAWVRENRGAWLALLGVKLRNFWSAFQYDDLSEITLLREEGVLTLGISFGLVAALGLPGMIIAIMCFPRARWVAAAVLLHMAALMPVFITERYRLCAVPGLLILAAVSVVEIWRSLANARWLTAGATLIAVGAATWFVSWPQRAPALRALDPFNTGLKVMRAGRLDVAQMKLETARELVPDNDEIHFALGNLFYEKGEMDRARASYRRSIELDRRNAGPWMNLGRLEAGERQWESAEKCLRTAISLDPASARALLFLAEMKYAREDFAGARAAVARALALRPGQPELLELQEKIRAAPAP